MQRYSSRAENYTSGGNVRWTCRCSCGKQFVTQGSNLKNGHTKSCGCLNRESAAKLGKASAIHGLRKSYLYTTYHHAKYRCNNPKHKAFKYYGGRGIEFRFSDVAQFAAELGERPTPQHSIDRIDNDGPYAPGNVKWSTRSEQQRNKRKYVMTPARHRQLIKANASRWAKKHLEAA